MTTTKTRFGKKYQQVLISDLNIGDHFLGGSYKPAKLMSIQGKEDCGFRTVTISWTYGLENKEGRISEGIWENDKVWIEIK